MAKTIKIVKGKSNIKPKVKQGNEEDKLKLEVKEKPNIIHLTRSIFLHKPKFQEEKGVRRRLIKIKELNKNLKASGIKSRCKNRSEKSKYEDGLAKKTRRLV